MRARTCTGCAAQEPRSGGRVWDMRGRGQEPHLVAAVTDIVIRARHRSLRARRGGSRGGGGGGGLCGGCASPHRPRPGGRACPALEAESCNRCVVLLVGHMVGWTQLAEVPWLSRMLTVLNDGVL
jgi:hypothetical protein